MSKRGLVAYSDALRLEHGDEIDVTTVYPGYIRTRHPRRGEGRAASGSRARSRPSASRTPRGRSPARRSGVRCATSRRPARATIQYFLARRSPRRLLDRITTLRVRRLARSGAFAPAASRESWPRGSRALARGKTRFGGTERGQRRSIARMAARSAGGATRGRGGRRAGSAEGACEAARRLLARGSARGSLFHWRHPTGRAAAPASAAWPKIARARPRHPVQARVRLAAMADGWSALFSTAFKQSKNAMALVDSQRRHVDVNPAYLRLLGYDRDGVIGRPVYRVRRRRPAAVARALDGRAGVRPLPRRGELDPRGRQHVERAVGGPHGGRHRSPARAVRGARHVALGLRASAAPPRPIPSRARCPRASSRSCG